MRVVILVKGVEGFDQFADAGLIGVGQRPKSNPSNAGTKHLGQYLRDERSNGDKGQRTVTHLIAAVGLTEADIFDAAFDSDHIKRTTGKDGKGIAAGLFFEYID